MTKSLITFAGDLQSLNVAPQQAHTEGVEGGDQRHRHGARANQRFHAAGHFRRSLVGEGHGQDGIRLRAQPIDEVRNAIGDYARLAAAGARQDEHRPLDRFDGLTLLRVELAQIRRQS